MILQFTDATNAEVSTPSGERVGRVQYVTDRKTLREGQWVPLENRWVAIDRQGEWVSMGNDPEFVAEALLR